jgi:SAM-dependent methyltransferase
MNQISDAARLRNMKACNEPRSVDRLRFHYEIEKALADRLRNSNKQDRTTLYTECYEALFSAVVDHPQFTNKYNNEAEEVRHRLQLILPLVQSGATLLEVGAGDCRLSIAAAPYVRRVIALDVAATIMSRKDFPPNVEPCLSDGTSIPVPPGSVDIAYSDQLMEHLHPDDALEQLRNVYEALKPGGHYLCITPNRLQGPHDISRYFDDVATGLHLREYTNKDLAALMRQVGFRKVHSLVVARGRRLKVPADLVGVLECAVAALPLRLRSLFSGPLSSAVFGVQVVASR